jgi:hypothetical protein
MVRHASLASKDRSTVMLDSASRYSPAALLKPAEEIMASRGFTEKVAPSEAFATVISDDLIEAASSEHAQRQARCKLSYPQIVSSCPVLRNSVGLGQDHI